FPHRAAAWRAAASAGPPAVARGYADWPPRLQAAIRRSDPAGSARALDHHRCPRSHCRGAGRHQPRDARQRPVACLRDSMTFTRTVMLEQGDTGWRKIQSIFSAVRMWGAGVHTACAVQIALALMLTASLPRLWQSDAAFDLKASALATACLLATPYVLDYELVVLAVSIAF